VKNILAIAVVAIAAFVLLFVARLVGGRAQWRAGRPARAAARAKGSPSREALVAAIAAAVCATSGMESGSFRIAGISASEGLDGRPGFPGRPGDSWSRGFNTPLWGHIDRNQRGE